MIPSLLGSYCRRRSPRFPLSSRLLFPNYCNSEDDDEQYCYAFVPVSKLQPRKLLSKGRWIKKMGMAEVEVHKGSIWKTTCIVRCGKIYCSIEEALFMAELGAFLLMDDAGASISIEKMYMNLSDDNNGCFWELFQAYKQLKSLGYVVGRHGIPWSLKHGIMTGGPLSLHTGSYGSLQQQNGFSNYQSTPVLVRKSSKLLRSSSREKEKLRPLLGRFFGRRKVAMLLLVFLALLVFVFGSFTVNKDTKSARGIMLVELKKMIEANKLFWEKLQFYTLKNSRLRTLINQSCGQPNGARAPSPVTNPLMGGPVQKAGSFPPLSAHAISAHSTCSFNFNYWVDGKSIRWHPSLCVWS
ncbi:hypothetical protein CsatB_002974 [Cannabis sativa]